jgi:hypothetical protein
MGVGCNEPHDVVVIIIIFYLPWSDGEPPTLVTFDIITLFLAEVGLSLFRIFDRETLLAGEQQVMTLIVTR